MNQEITLPPLPDGVSRIPEDYLGQIYLEPQMRQAQRAAVALALQGRHLKERAQLDAEWAALRQMQEACRQGRGEAVAWLYEDDLPTGYPYDEMYPFSKVDGVRMFPVFWPDTVLTRGYMEGHSDALEWAARLAEANHPLTGDWLYDDPHDLAEALRKGPEMPPVEPQPAEPVKGPSVDDIADIVYEHLTSVYVCNRVWEAWSVGTMGADDFVEAAETEMADEIAAAIVARYASAQPAASAELQNGQQNIHGIIHGVPDGWKLVPERIPPLVLDRAITWMRGAMNEADRDLGYCIPQIWKLVLDAAPSPPAHGKQDLSHYAEAEREHLGDPERQTGIYAPKADDTPTPAEEEAWRQMEAAQARADRIFNAAKK